MARVRVQVPVEQKPEPAPAPPPPSAPNQPETPRGSFPLKKALLILGVIIGILFVNSIIQDRNRLQKQLGQKQSVSSGNEVESIVAQLSKAVELPKDETPQLRTIENAATFREQSPVFSEINDGDMWLFYAKSGKQVFYRPSTKKVIFVVPLVQQGEPTRN